MRERYSFDVSQQSAGEAPTDREGKEKADKDEIIRKFDEETDNIREKIEGLHKSIEGLHKSIEDSGVAKHEIPEKFDVGSGINLDENINAAAEARRKYEEGNEELFKLEQELEERESISNEEKKLQEEIGELDEKLSKKSSKKSRQLSEDKKAGLEKQLKEKKFSRIINYREKKAQEELGRLRELAKKGAEATAEPEKPAVKPGKPAAAEKPETKLPAAEKSPKEKAAEEAKEHFESLEKVEDSAKVINLQAEYQLFIKGKIERNPDIAQEELEGYLEAAGQSCGLEASDIWIQSEREDIKNYITNRKKILELQERHKENNSGLIKELLGKEISEEEAGKITIEYGPTNIRIFVNTGERKEEDQVAENRDLFRKLASLKKGAESAEVGEGVRDSIISRNIERKGNPNCVIYDIKHRAVEWSKRKDKKESHEGYSLDNLKKHEDEHSRFLRRNQELARRLKKGSLEHALFWAQNEILPSVFNNKTTERFAYKFTEGAPGFGTYDYAKQLEDEEDKTSYYDQVKKVLLPQEGGEMSLLDKLAVAIEGNREKAVALLTREHIALERWPEEIDSIIKAYGKKAENMINKEREKREKKKTKKKEVTSEKSKDELSIEELVKATKEKRTRWQPEKPKEKKRGWWKRAWSPTSAEVAEQEQGMVERYEKVVDWLHSKIVAPVADKLNPIIDKTPLLPTMRSAYRWVRGKIDKHPTTAHKGVEKSIEREKEKEKEGDEGGRGKTEPTVGESAVAAKASAEGDRERSEAKREKEFEKRFNALYEEISSEENEDLILWPVNLGMYIAKVKQDIEGTMDKEKILPKKASELVSDYGVPEELANKISDLLDDYKNS